jgi:hypothetical protein
MPASSAKTPRTTPIPDCLDLLIIPHAQSGRAQQPDTLSEHGTPRTHEIPQPQCSFVTDLCLPDVHNSSVTPESLTRTVQDFLAEASGALVLEDGAVSFDLARAKYSISGEYNKCLLHLWSAERNAVRRVLDAEVKSGTLRLAVQRLGQSRPTKLEI